MPSVRSKPALILASTSAPRRSLMAGAGLTFTCEAARIDERAIEAQLANASPETVALRLAEEKALDVSRRFPGALVIGADQTLSLGPLSFHKPASEVAARDQLQVLRGQTHRLNAGIACAVDGEVTYRHVAVAAMTMRAFSDAFLDHYMTIAGKAVLSSVGCYQLEGPGIQLFERINGDYFTILGLPLLPLLAYLRSVDAIDV